MMSPMTSSTDDAGPHLRLAIVLGATEDACAVYAEGQRRTVPFARVFPAPRAERVFPGHLVATTTMAGGQEVIVWRWFDAVVLDVADALVSLWEPGHGTVAARAREPRHAYRPGTRAYLSAGLPGAEWWVSGPAVDEAALAAVELDAVKNFFTENDLWKRLA
jgi:hypothetical protein